MKKLLDSGIHMIDISLDAHTNETYQKIRIGGDLNITSNNVLKLIELNEKSNYKTKIVVSFIEQPQNSNEIEDFKNFGQKK